MIRKLALAGAMALGFSALAWAASTPIPTHLNASGVEEDSVGVVCLNETTGDPETCGGAGGGGGGAVTIVDGGAVTLGAKADAKSTATDTTAITLMSVAKQISASVQATATSVAGAQPAGTAIIGKVGIDQTTPGTTNGVQVNAALPAGTAIVGKVGIDQTTPGTTNGVQVNAALPAGTNTVGNVGLASGTTGGCTPYHLLSAANTNPTLVSTGAHTLCFISAINTTGTIYYLKLYNQVAAPSTCATDAANVVMNFPIPASASAAGFTISLAPYGAAFGTGLAFCLTGAQADNDTTNAATGINLNLGYK